MNEEQPFISIVVPSLIIDKMTLHISILCLETLKSFTENYEVVMVEGFSGSYTLPIERSIRKEDNLIKNEGYISIPQAWNIGIANAKSDYVVLLPNDCIVHNNWLTNLWKAKVRGDKLFGEDKNYKFIGCHPVGMTKEEIKEWKDRVRMDELNAGIANSTFTYMGAFGNLFHKKWYEELGPFDENLPLTYCDRDYHERVASKGWSCGMAVDANISHISGVTWDKLFTGQIKVEGIKTLEEEVEYFKKKWGHNP